MELIRRVPEGAHAGQKDLIRLSEHIRLPGNNGLCANGGEGAFERKQVSHAVVHDGDHPRTPLVEGISSAQAGSMATALRKLRAKDLKQPSMM